MLFHRPCFLLLSDYDCFSDQSVHTHTCRYSYECHIKLRSISTRALLLLHYCNATGYNAVLQLLLLLLLVLLLSVTAVTSAMHTRFVVAFNAHHKQLQQSTAMLHQTQAAVAQCSTARLHCSATAAAATTTAALLLLLLLLLLQ
jgi:hypothetical protein